MRHQNIRLTRCVLILKQAFLLHISIVPTQPPTHQSSPATSQSITNIAVASWGEGIVGTSSHALHSKGVVSSRGVQHEVKSSKDMYPSLKPKTPDPNRNNGLYTDFARVTPVPRQSNQEQAAVTIQRYLQLPFIAAFSITCIAAILRHSSFDIVFRRAA